MTHNTTTLPRKKQKPKHFEVKQTLPLEQRISAISAAVIIILAAAISIFLIGFPRSTQSQIEKRELAKFPKFSVSNYFSGAFTSGITHFYNDTIPFRDTFKNCGNRFKTLFGIQTKDIVAIVGNPVKTVSKQSLQ